MNILHMKYAVEVARLGSLNKAAESLLIAQPNISRSIKELEQDLGISIFSRSAKGMLLTAEGEEFIGFAQSILKQIDDVEALYKSGSVKKQRFSISVPSACYISHAFAEFSKSISSEPAEIFFEETSSQNTINGVLGNECKLGIIRCPENYDKHFKAMLEEKGLAYELIAELSYSLLMNKNNPLASNETVKYGDISELVEIRLSDNLVPNASTAKSAKGEISDDVKRRIAVFERASVYDILSQNTQAFAWASPVSSEILNGYGLVQKKCADSEKRYKDLLIYRKSYKLSRLDKQFITSLCEAKRLYIG